MTDVNVYTKLMRAWEQRMQYLLAGDSEAASKVWGEMYWSMPEGTEIEWVTRDDAGADCIIAGTMYFEDTASRLVRVPK